MATTHTPQSFMANCREFFGTHPGQTAMQFGKEVQMLSPEDRAEIQAGLERLGFVFATPTSPAR